jgi:hypothetical protein
VITADVLVSRLANYQYDDESLAQSNCVLRVVVIEGFTCSDSYLEV